MSRKAQIYHEILSMADIVACALVERMGLGTSQISQRQAWQEFGRRRIETMVEEGLLHPQRIGEAKNSRVMYSRKEILAVIEAERQLYESIVNQ